MEKSKCIFSPLMIHRYVPTVLPANAPMYSLKKNRRGQFKRISRVLDDSVGWFRVGQYLVPYIWNEINGTWHHGVHTGVKYSDVDIAMKYIHVNFSPEDIPSSLSVFRQKNHLE